jgi:predicted RNA binding protein YcfA (HicA-like mRNA interferase family)
MNISEKVTAFKIGRTRKDIIPAISKLGWYHERHRGDHDIYGHPDHPHKIAIPKHRGDLAPGTIRDIMKKAGITEDIDIIKRTTFHIIKDIIKKDGDDSKTWFEETNTEKRKEIVNVSRPDNSKPSSSQSKLVKTTEIQRKIIEGSSSMNTQKNFGLTDSLITAVRLIAEKTDKDMGGMDARKMVGGKTKVDICPTTKDKLEDDGSKKTVKESTHGENVNKSEVKRFDALNKEDNKITKTITGSCKICGKKPCVCKSVKEETIVVEENKPGGEPLKVGTKVKVDGKKGEINYVQKSNDPKFHHSYKITDLDANDPYKEKRLENGNYISHARVKVVKEEEITESLRLVKTHTNGNKTAKVYKDNDWDEFRVRHYTDGKHHTKADAHTNDVEDAHDTAKHFINHNKQKVAEDIVSQEEINRLKEIAKSFPKE